MAPVLTAKMMIVETVDSAVIYLDLEILEEMRCCERKTCLNPITKVIEKETQYYDF